MDNKIISDIEKLNAAIKEDPRYINFKAANEKMENDKDAISLSMKKDELNNKYNDMVKYFGEKSNEALNAQKELYIVKKELDELPVVKEYYVAYKKYKEIYNSINKEIFQDFESIYINKK